MARQTVVTAGYYGGDYLPVGASYEAPDAPDGGPDNIGSMSKDELIAEAERRQVEVKPSMTKAEIIELLNKAPDLDAPL